MGSDVTEKPMTTATLPAAVSMRPAREAGLARVWIARLLAVLLAANAASMLFAAEAWYRSVPGVAATGPFNHHFVGDIGLAFLAAAVALFVGALKPDRLAGFALPAAVFLAGHAILHLAGYGLHEHAGGTWFTDAVAIHLPALIALWLALPPPPGRVVGAALAGRLSEAMIRYGERKLGVTLDYMREIAANAPASFRLLGRVSQIGQSLKPVDRHATHMAALGAAMHDDCGTCVQIHINLARQQGVAEDVLRRAVMGEAGSLPAPLAAAFRFGEAVAANDPEMHELRERLEADFGKRAVIEMAIAIAFARFYPTLKRALGHAKSCAVLRFDFGGAHAHA
jgi:AhpD family alkylhydroperoxidase